MCLWFHISHQTLERRCKKKYGETFGQVFEKKRVGGLISLRRNLFKLSEKNVAAAIFLAKNLLGMADRTEISNPPGESFRVEHDAKSKLLNELNRFAARAGEAKSDTKAEPEGS